MTVIVTEGYHRLASLVTTVVTANTASRSRFRFQISYSSACVGSVSTQRALWPEVRTRSRVRRVI